jgi:hypothetical protein
MMKGYFCVAGIDMETRAHVRPVLGGARLRTTLLDPKGPFSMAAVVDLGEVHRCGLAPEVEDVQFDPRRARKLHTLAPAEFWQMLVSATAPDLKSLFGPGFKRAGATGAVEPGNGIASLGCIVPSRAPALAIDHRDRVRALVHDGGELYDLAVTDLRLYENNHETPRESVVQSLNDRLAGAVRVVVAVGLSRAFAAREGEPPLHWLQANNLHLEDDPAWPG